MRDLVIALTFLESYFLLCKFWNSGYIKNRLLSSIWNWKIWCQQISNKFSNKSNNSKDFKWACEAAHFWQRVSEITQKWYWFALAYFNLSEILFNFLASLGKSFYIKLCSFYHFVVVFTFCCIFTFFCTFTGFRGLMVNIFISLDGKILFLNFSRVTLFCEKHWAYISVRSFFTSRQGHCKQSNGWSTFFWKCLCF